MLLLQIAQPAKSLELVKFKVFERRFLLNMAANKSIIVK